MTTGWVVLGLAVGGVGAATVGSILRSHDRPGVTPLSIFVVLLSGLAVVVAFQRGGHETKKY